MFSGVAQAAPVYLNDSRITVALGPLHAADPEPFANRTTAASLASVIDAPTSSSTEFHTQTTHVWVSGGALELIFDFGAEYDLSALHFWNYHSEPYDVDNISFEFRDGSNAYVDTLTVAPRLGNTDGSDGTPITPEDYALAFPTNVRYVTALLTGSNNQVDFNNIGFTADLSNPQVSVPEPGSLALLATGLIAGAAALRRRPLRGARRPAA